MVGSKIKMKFKSSNQRKAVMIRLTRKDGRTKIVKLPPQINIKSPTISRAKEIFLKNNPKYKVYDVTLVSAPRIKPKVFRVTGIKK